jgi:hypothetical protein
MEGDAQTSSIVAILMNITIHFVKTEESECHSYEVNPCMDSDILCNLALFGTQRYM